jgi:hypothetical protein
VLDSSFAFNAQRMFSSLVHHPMPDQCHPSSQSTMLLLPPSPVLDDFLPSSPLQGLRDTTFDPFLLPSHIQETPTKHVMTLSSTFTDEDNNRNLSFLSSASTHLDLTFQLDRTITSIYVNADHANIERNIFSPATPAPNEYHQSRQQSYHQGYQRDHTQDHQKHSHSFRRTAFDLSAHECTQLSSSAFQLVSGFCSDRVPGLDYPPVSTGRTTTTEVSPSGRNLPLKSKPRLKLKTRSRSRKAKKPVVPMPSNFCHSCGRSRSRRNITSCLPSNLVMCGRIQAGCRKVVCASCIAKHGWAGGTSALDTNNTDVPVTQVDAGWACPHCAGLCGDFAQCATYGRTNFKRHVALREKRLAAANDVFLIQDHEV